MSQEAQSKVENGIFWGRCRICGRWREVQAQTVGADSFFSYWQGLFHCCNITQVANFTLEKEDDDVH